MTNPLEGFGTKTQSASDVYNQYANNSEFLNNALIKQYHMIPMIITIVVIAIVIIMIKVILSSFNIKDIKKNKGVTNEIAYVNKIKKREASIVKNNKFIAKITERVEKTAFRQDKLNKEYVEYNLERADIRIPGGARVYRAEEFNAIIVFLEACLILLSIIIGLLANAVVAIVIIFTSLVLAINLPMMIIRGIVKSKDDEINDNFLNFYCMMHYTLLAKSNTPLSSIMKSYAKATDSKEMIHMMDVCIHYIDTYGEYEATEYISQAYREIPSVCKLMRLIKQLYNGGNIEEELKGFRQELLNTEDYNINAKGDKLVNKAFNSFNILMIVLFQAIISAASIYLPNMGILSSFISH